MYIEKVVINNYKNYYKSEIELNKNINIIIGPNNIGKSNFLTIIKYLSIDPNKENSGIDDFNKNNLYMNYKNYLDKAPNIEIIYTIKHLISENDENTMHGFSKILQMVVYNEQGEPSKIKDNIFETLAVLKLKYEIDPQYNDDYKNQMRGIEDYEAFYDILKKFGKRYSWNFYDNNGNEINRNIVNSIFSLQFVEATRVIDEVSTIAKKNVNKKLKDANIDEEGIRKEVTKLFNNTCHEIIDDINKEIEADQSKIGITDGKNRFVSTFDYRGNIEDSFKYELQNDDKKAPYYLPLGNNGLGYNNLIYIRNLIKNIDSDVKSKSEYNILLLEEPEAHLHPNMQYKLIKYIRTLIDANNDKEQIFITTHSPNISASAKIEDLILLYANVVENVFNINAIQLEQLFKPENLLKHFLNENKEKEEVEKKLNKSRSHLMKFLDVTRSDILFSTKIILVEGVAERLLIPKFFADLENYHVVIIELGGINFDHFLPLTINTNKKVLCVTDADFKYYYKKDKSKYDVVNLEGYKSTSSNVSALFTTKIDNKNIKVVTQKNCGNTFETELLIENYSKDEAWSLLIEASPMPEALIERCKKKSYIDCKNLVENDGQGETINKKTVEVVKKYVEIFKEKLDSESEDIKKFYEKIFFINLVYHYIRNCKGEFALNILSNPKFNTLNIPTYIKEGVEWLIKNEKN